MPKGHIRAYFTNSKYKAKQRGLSFTLNPQEFAELVQMPCFYCAAEPTRLASKFAGSKAPSRKPAAHKREDPKCHSLDRLDNDRGYEMGNVVSCCWDCNRVKGPLSIGGLLCHLPRMLVGLTTYVTRLKKLESLKPSISVTDAQYELTARTLNFYSVPHSNTGAQRLQASASPSSDRSTSTRKPPALKRRCSTR